MVSFIEKDSANFPPHRKYEFDDEVKVLLFFSKGASIRRKILQKMCYGLKNCNQLANELKANWWTIQRHLQRLEKINIIKGVKFGNTRFYTITAKGKLILTALAYFEQPHDSYTNCIQFVQIFKKQK